MLCMCGEEINKDRVTLGYDTCLKCGEQESRKKKHCIVPVAKSNYIVITNKKELKGLNKIPN